jgi:predicted transcriptional regulator of viral defense system
MKIDDLRTLVGGMNWFDMPVLVQAFPDRRSAIRLQLSRWIKQGKVVALRRGMYTLSDQARKVRLDPAVLAQHLCRPSYLSGVWALGFHDMIPERVVAYTSVTTRLPARFDNAYGVYEYRHIKPECFFGYEHVPYGDSSIIVARPEKALLDHWHLSPGEWTTDRLVEMRYHNWEKVNHDRLREAAARFQRPRLQRAVDRWVMLATHSDDGTVTL